MKKAFVKKSIVLCSVALLLLGCGGGGGGGGSSVTPTFVKWSAVAPPTTITVGGISQDGTYTAPAPTYKVTSFTDKGVSTSSSATITYRADGSIEQLSISTPTTSVAWNAAAGDTIAADASGTILTMVNPIGSNIGMTIVPSKLGWDYQTFGVWLTGYNTGVGTIGAISIGAPTAGSAIPISGTATFTGGTLGFYVDATGSGYMTTSPITLNTNFLNRTLNLTTTSTQKVAFSTGVQSAATNLNMTGLLTYTAGNNLFTGTVTATGLAGNSTGKFYGPNAEELGGVFKLTGAGVEAYAGAYGAKR